ncbi:MAG: extracellular solute-binding protein [Alphaproteobacteria bacterium]|nr:extracellular solute-binding protein [Alphaproteobacteria bacterium]
MIDRPDAGRRRFVAGAPLAAMMLAGAVRAQTPAAYAAPPRGAANAKRIALRFGTSYVGVQPMTKPVRDILDKFQADYPNVSIAVEATAGNDHQTKIKLDASADRVPDFFNYWRLDPGFGLDQIARAGRLADLTAWTREDPHFKGLFDDSSWRTATLDGKVYGVPLLMFYVQFLANKAVFDRAGVALPTDWASLNTAVKALKSKGELPWAISIGNDSQGGRIYNYVVNRTVGNERAMRMHGGLEPINVPEMVRAMEMLRDLVVGYAPDDAIAIKNEVVYAKYVNANRGGLILDGSWVTAQIKPEIQKDLVVLEFPLIPGGFQKEPNVERDLTTLLYMSSKAMADADKRPYVVEIVRRLTARDAGRVYSEEAKAPIPMLGVPVDDEKYGRIPREANAIALRNPANKWIPSAMKPDQRAKFEPLLGEFLAGKHEPARFVEQLGRIFGG